MQQNAAEAQYTATAVPSVGPPQKGGPPHEMPNTGFEVIGLLFAGATLLVVGLTVRRRT